MTPKRTLLAQAEKQIAVPNLRYARTPLCGGLASSPCLPSNVAATAWEVYCHIYGAEAGVFDPEQPQEIGSLIACLYAHSYPRNEWAARVVECLKTARI